MVVEEHVTPRKFAVTAGSADLLHVVFDRARHVVVDHRLDVAFVDTHRERDRAAEHAHLVVAEELLDVGPLLVCLARVIRLGWDALLVQVCGNLIGGLTLGRIKEDRVELFERVCLEQGH